MQTQLVRKSSNSKVGPIAISNTARSSCPPACPLWWIDPETGERKGPCYADSGFHTALNWNKVDSGERGTTFDQFCIDLGTLKPGSLFRHNVSGDLIGKKDKIDKPALTKLVKAASHLQPFTYCHYPVTDKHNRDALIDANNNGFTINASANSLSEARDILAAYQLPVVTVLPIEYQRTSDRKGWAESLAEYKARLSTLDCDQLTVCPATYRDNVSCSTCKLCAVSKRKNNPIVGFPAHGTKAKQADIIATSGA